MKKFVGCVVMMLALTSFAFSQGYDIKTLTPDVKSALDARKARFSDLKMLKAKGVVGENNRGYVEALGGAADVKSLVSAENVDRKALYAAIVVQNELGDAALSTVEGVFAGVQRDKAVAGEKVQDLAGNWITK
jgi:uncharacterized protein YdbL (DUF1318 family)